MYMRFYMLIVVITLGSLTLHAQQNPVVGTWKQNIAKSKFNGPALQSRTMKQEPAGTNFKNTTEAVDAEGKKTTEAYTAKFDGKDYPHPGGNRDPKRDVISWRMNGSVWETMSKRDGKVSNTSKRVLSPDGKVLTVTTMRSDGTVTMVSVYEKQ